MPVPEPTEWTSLPRHEHVSITLRTWWMMFILDITNLKPLGIMHALDMTNKLLWEMMDD